jgi:hypothetical protein
MSATVSIPLQPTRNSNSSPQTHPNVSSAQPAANASPNPTQNTLNQTSSTSTSSSNQPLPVPRFRSWLKRFISGPLGSAISWCKPKVKAIRKKLNIDRRIAAGAVFIGVALGWTAYPAWKLAKWTALKDYIEYCQSNIVSPWTPFKAKLICIRNLWLQLSKKLATK